MSDYIGELVKRLDEQWGRRRFSDSPFGEMSCLLADAADALEALLEERDRLKDEVERLRNEKVAVGVGSQILGKGAYQFIVDDPFGPPTEPAPAVCEWQTIETAPTDGTLICGAWMYGSRWAAKSLLGDGRRWATKSLFWNGHNWECPDSILDGYFGPTHWMPLPPPEAKE